MRAILPETRFQQHQCLRCLRCPSPTSGAVRALALVQVAMVQEVLPQMPSGQAVAVQAVAMVQEALPAAFPKR